MTQNDRIMLYLALAGNSIMLYLAWVQIEKFFGL